MLKLNSLVKCLGGVALIAISSQAGAERDKVTFIHPSMQSKNIVTVGAYHQASNSRFDLRGSSSSRGFDLDNLGLNKSYTTINTHYRRRLSQRFNLDVEYNKYINRGERALESEIEFEGVIYDVGAEVRSRFRTNTYSIRTTYDFYQTPTTTLGVGVGVHALKLVLELEGEGTVNGESTKTHQLTTDSLHAPLPNILLNTRHAFNDQWMVALTTGWLQAKSGRYEGDTGYIDALIEYRVKNGLSIAAAYQYLDIDLTRTGDPLDYRYRIKRSGPKLMLRWAF